MGEPSADAGYCRVMGAMLGVTVTVALAVDTLLLALTVIEKPVVALMTPLMDPVDASKLQPLGKEPVYVKEVGLPTAETAGVMVNGVYCSTMMGLAGYTSVKTLKAALQQSGGRKQQRYVRYAGAQLAQRIRQLLQLQQLLLYLVLVANKSSGWE